MSKDPRSLRIDDYTYDLPDDRIARYPLQQRDASKLLVYEQGQIETDIFRYIATRLPEGATLVLNTAKVVRARMHFRKPTGGAIEIFCLEPHPQHADISTALATQGEVLWQCLVGGAAKWKEGTTLTLESGPLKLEAQLHMRNSTDFTIHFQWTPEHLTWAEVMEMAGQVPLPPYLNREAEAQDVETYQTLFAKHEGSVAAPTASLHFTPGVLDSIESLGVRIAQVTLHVGAGTFKPVKSKEIGGHQMHGEWIEVSAETIAALIAGQGHPIIAAGTTALRTLESLYWLGCKAYSQPAIAAGDLKVLQWEWCASPGRIPVHDALLSLQEWMANHKLTRLISRTEILIAPGYKFRLVDALITNFH